MDHLCCIDFIISRMLSDLTLTGEKEKGWLVPIRDDVRSPQEVQQRRPLFFVGEIQVSQINAA